MRLIRPNGLLQIYFVKPFFQWEKNAHICTLHRDVAQLVEYASGGRVVAGSSPVILTESHGQTWLFLCPFWQPLQRPWITLSKRLEHAGRQNDGPLRRRAGRPPWCSPWGCRKQARRTQVQEGREDGPDARGRVHVAGAAGSLCARERTKDGWPHFTAGDPLPALSPAEQETMMKRALLDYFAAWIGREVEENKGWD